MILPCGKKPQLAHFKSAAIAARLGAVNDAIKEYESSQQVFEELIHADPTRLEPRAQLALSHNNLGLLYAGRSEADRARAEYLKAIEIQKRLVQEHADDPIVAGQLAESEANLGLLLDQAGESKGAEQSLRAAIQVLRPLADANSNQPKLSRDLAIACNNLSFVLRTRDPAAADVASQEAIQILERLAKPATTGSDYQDDLALCYNNRAALQIQKGDWKAAIESHQQAIALAGKDGAKSPAVVRYRSDLAISLNNLGMAYCRAGKSAEADAAFGRGPRSVRHPGRRLPRRTRLSQFARRASQQPSTRTRRNGPPRRRTKNLPHCDRLPAQMLRPGPRVGNDA